MKVTFDDQIAKATQTLSKLYHVEHPELNESEVNEVKYFYYNFNNDILSYFS